LVENERFWVINGVDVDEFENNDETFETGETETKICDWFVVEIAVIFIAAVVNADDSPPMIDVDNFDLVPNVRFATFATFATFLVFWEPFLGVRTVARFAGCALCITIIVQTGS
jgi:hypothetical protein